MGFGLRLLRKAGLLPHLVLHPSIRYGGQHFRIPFHHGIGWLYFSQDEHWMDVLLKVLLQRSTGTFVDVGANIGQTWLKVRALSANTPYLGFEPNPACAAYIDELARLNGWPPPRLVPAGLAATDGPLDLVLFSEDISDGRASVVPGFRPEGRGARHIIVPCYAFSTVERSMPIDKVGIIKIDVEGGELGVLQGCHARLQQDRPAIIMEILPVHRAENRERLERQEALERLLHDLGYALYLIVAEGASAHLERIEGAIGIHSDMARTNYLALTPDQAEWFKERIKA